MNNVKPIYKTETAMSQAHQNLFALAIVTLLFGSLPMLSHAQTDADKSVLITVNGKGISQFQLDEAVRSTPNPEQANTAEGRRALLEELISRELVSQDAIKKKLDETAQAQFQLQQARQSVLIDLAVADHFQKNPIDEAAMRAEYRRQIDALKALGPMQQYQIRLLVLPTEAQARDAIRDINKGQSMEQLIRQSSIDPSRANGGLLDWLLPNQMLPMVSNVVENLSKGKLSVAPIQTPNGWNVVRVEDVRTFTPPKFEDATAQLRASLIQQRRAAYLNQLRESAKLQRP
jgi:peptidyl-prolyl cis-trans isomerase C